MKFILPVVCSILFIGCSDSANTKTSAITETQTITAPATENPSSQSPDVTTPSAAEATVASAEATPAPVAVSVDGGALFTQKCASCHGSKAEKSALGKSQIIADFTKQQIKDALKGYQAGTYGKEMKGLMQGQVKSLSGEQINALAKHITTL